MGEVNIDAALIEKGGVVGQKDDSLVALQNGLTAVKGGIGSALMMESHFAKINANVVATLYCGNEFFLNNQDEVVTKFTAMVKKLNPDYVVCGPCFNFPDYAKMAAMVSANMDYRSFRLNFEVNAFAYNEKLTAQLKQDFENDMKKSTLLTPEYFANQSKWRKFKQYLSRLLSPIL